MKEFIDNLISRLEERKKEWNAKGIEFSFAGGTTIVDETVFGTIRGLYEAIGIVNQLAEEYKGGWIPCSKELPVWRDNVLVCTESGGRTIAYMRLTENDWYDMYDTKIENVIAWMPLPEPYQKEGE